jgi:hypothetical protein
VPIGSCLRSTLLCAAFCRAVLPPLGFQAPLPLLSFWFFPQRPPPGLCSYGAPELLVPGLIASSSLAVSPSRSLLPSRAPPPEGLGSSLCVSLLCSRVRVRIFDFFSKRRRSVCSSVPRAVVPRATAGPGSLLLRGARGEQQPPCPISVPPTSARVLSRCS